MTYSFHINDVPTEYTLTTFLEKNTDIAKQREKFKKFPQHHLFSRSTPFDGDKLWISIQQAFKQFGWWGFLRSTLITNDDSRYPLYGGLSLTYNPLFKTTAPVDAQTLGAKRFNFSDFFQDDVGQRVWNELIFNEHSRKLKDQFFNILEKQSLSSGIDFLFQEELLNHKEFHDRKEKYSSVKFDSKAKNQFGKHSYSDGLNFCYRSPCSDFGYIKNVLDDVQGTIVRSRISTLKAGGRLHWHIDDDIFFSIRINIPVSFNTPTWTTYNRQGGVFAPEIGQMYCWDTGQPHRVDIAETEGGERTTMIVSTSPWFDFDPKEQTWSSNQFYGQIHPLEMFKEGYVI